MRVAVRGYYELPPTYSVVLDLSRVYPWLGKEWQNVFDLYALGYPLIEIAHYWASLFGIVRVGTYREHQNFGSRLIKRLCQRLLWLLDRVVYPLVPPARIARPHPQ